MISSQSLHLGVKNSNLSKIACELLQLAKGWGNFISDRIIIWRLHYKSEIITYFAENFLSKTIEIISKLLESTGNVGNWIRKAASQEAFINELNNEISLDSKLEDMYKDFVVTYKK